MAGRLDEAEEYYREALELDPNSGLCHLGLSRLLEQQGRLDEAKLHSQRAEVLIDPNDYLLWQDFGDFINDEDDPA
jgi:tetratricopeptide (TPR) repeat protein